MFFFKQKTAYDMRISDWSSYVCSSDLHGASTAEISFLPNRVLMHDTTSTPALVDIAAMRDYVAREGGDPAVLTPSLPVDVSIDHSLAVEAFGQGDAVQVNMQPEIRPNAERYRFLRWASTEERRGGQG